MKKTIYILTLLCAATSTQAQVGIGTTSPATSSVLDVSSTTKGLLAPRMTTAQRDAITSPATGLQIYNTDNAAIETFTGTAGEWFTLGRGKGAIATNTAVGVNTLKSNTSGSKNTANGYYSLNSNTSGDYNTANGYYSLNSNTSGDYNIANGPFALRFNTTGNNNTVNGFAALYSNVTGSNNTAIGYVANVSSNNFSNATAIGNGATVTGSNKVRIGNSNVSTITGQVAWTSVSDGRIKENIQEAVPGLSFIAELRPVTYTLNTRKQDAINMQAMPDSIQEERMLSDDDYLASSSIVRTGFIAQEVEAAAQKIGFDFDGVSTPQNETDLYGIRYAEFVVPLVKAIQEQQEMIEGQEATITELKATIDQQKIDFQQQVQLLLKRIEALEK
jgi:hypothetical protein